MSKGASRALFFVGKRCESKGRRKRGGVEYNPYLGYRKRLLTGKREARLNEAADRPGFMRQRGKTALSAA